ncbi:MAG: hypothetical protein V3R73_06225 [Sphingomonadales bacterium]
MIRHLTLTLLAVAFMTMAGTMGQGQTQESGSFLTSMPEIPLMPGLVEEEDAFVVFDKPAGRFVETVFQGNTAPSAVREYYMNTLPPLGWKLMNATENARGGTLTFTREGERLVLVIGPAGSGATVRLRLEPIT